MVRSQPSMASRICLPSTISPDIQAFARLQLAADGQDVIARRHEGRSASGRMLPWAGKLVLREFRLQRPWTESRLTSISLSKSTDADFAASDFAAALDFTAGSVFLVTLDLLRRPGQSSTFPRLSSRPSVLVIPLNPGRASLIQRAAACGSNARLGGFGRLLVSDIPPGVRQFFLGYPWFQAHRFLVGPVRPAGSPAFCK